MLVGLLSYIPEFLIVIYVKKMCNSFHRQLFLNKNVWYLKLLRTIDLKPGNFGSQTSYFHL